MSLCCPSRTTTLRGQYSHNSGVESNGGSNGGFETAHKLGIERSTVGTWLQSAGYRTALIGKYLNGYPNTVAPTYVPPGWNEWDSASKGGNPYSEYNYTLNENGTLVRYGATPSDYGTDVYVKKAADFITQSAKAGKPSFTYLALYAPHQPATPAPRHAKLFPRAKAPRTAAYNEADVSDKPQWVQRVPLMTAAEQRSTDELYRERIRSLQAVDDGVASLVDELRRNGQLSNQPTRTRPARPPGRAGHGNGEVGQAEPASPSSTACVPGVTSISSTSPATVSSTTSTRTRTSSTTSSAQPRHP